MHCASDGQRESLITFSKRTVRSVSRIATEVPGVRETSAPIAGAGDGDTPAHAVPARVRHITAHAAAKDASESVIPRVYRVGRTDSKRGVRPARSGAPQSVGERGTRVSPALVPCVHTAVDVHGPA